MRVSDNERDIHLPRYSFTDEPAFTTMVLFEDRKGAVLMIKAVFFDLYHTLVRYEPPQEVLLAKALKDLGIDANPEVFRRPLVTAD